MAIDRIGKGGPVAPPAPAEVGRGEKSERTFEVGRPREGSPVEGVRAPVA